LEAQLTLEENIGALLIDQGLTLATAESCTGGLIAHRLTNVPGSSAYFVGGFVAYAYGAKEELLGVRHATLVRYGAVSQETALEMAQGVRQRLGVDVGLSVTGIAGPAGETPTKPVGLVYIGLAGPHGDRCHRHVFTGDRPENKDSFATAALEAIIAYVHPARSGKRGDNV
jgi:PncC family amidohydrolase